jgi:myosin heavy subunit
MSSRGTSEADKKLRKQAKKKAQEAKELAQLNKQNEKELDKAEKIIEELEEEKAELEEIIEEEGIILPNVKKFKNKGKKSARKVRRDKDGNDVSYRRRKVKPLENLAGVKFNNPTAMREAVKGLDPNVNTRDAIRISKITANKLVEYFANAKGTTKESLEWIIRTSIRLVQELGEGKTLMSKHINMAISQASTLKM